MLVKMKNTVISLILIISGLLVSCMSENKDDFGNGIDFGNAMNGGVSSSSSSSIDSSEELFNFDVSVNDDFFTETEVSDPSDEDLVENTVFDETIPVVFSDEGVTCGSLPEGVSADISGADIIFESSSSSNIIYKLSGTSDNGMFKIYSDRKFAVELSNLTLANADGPAINIQTKKRAFLCIDDGSVNTLADGVSYADTGGEDAKGVIFSEGQLVFSGNGKLTVNANCKAGISSDQYLRFRKGNVIDVIASEGNAVRGKDSVLISGGVLNLTVSGSGNKGLKTDGPMIIAGGRTTVVNSADAYYDTSEDDTKGPAGVNCGGNFQMRGGELYIKASGKGGKGISADGDALFSGGLARVITTGTKFTYGTSSSGMNNRFNFNNNSSSDYNKSPKGIRAEGMLDITGGDIMSRATGGDGSEAIEGKSEMAISGGTVQAYAYDDAVNSGAAMYLSGGSVFAVSQHNDGLDSNGNMNISGGSIVTFGLGEDGVDVIERGTLSITGGTLFSLGNTYMTSPSSGVSSQPSIVQSISGLSSGTVVALTDNGTYGTLFSYTMPLTVNKAYMILSLPSLTKGSSYTLLVGSATQSVSL